LPSSSTASSPGLRGARIARSRGRAIPCLRYQWQSTQDRRRALPWRQPIPTAGRGTLGGHHVEAAVVAAGIRDDAQSRIADFGACALGRTGAGKMDGMNKLTLEPNFSAVAFTSGTTAR
jgi:hypothetical protein